MLLKKNNFYVIKFMDLEVIIYYNQDEDMEMKQVETREATQLEKEYWFDAMSEIDETMERQKFDAVSLDEFDNWKKEKGY